ncbi:uncharacterized protein GGS25DRAFT_320596 [Hypoxylon fragiforme]|uniref:uncharacterized protein n=1 Tax=Hypoxylon fragiforme TaxID=63214 RepID=UPI0020C6DBDC|nr:uncharacterized protein GGS25DRAFT_320596 [Hypoxylon fragiforme]KAI2607153.1 hypothetical protein GGS25DRAFT_320596 [Hypoxylon fragiforme]
MTNHTVPKTTEVIPGAHVNIVLKADQRTGRQVSGAVCDVLTRGDHHRGIKVRLTDGRIGRVQSMATNMASVSPASTSGSNNLTPIDNYAPLTNETMMNSSANARISHLPRGRRPRYQDMRLEEQPEVATEQVELSAFIVPAKRKGKKKRNGNGNGPNDPNETGQPSGSARTDDLPSNTGLNPVMDVTSATVTCPVCGAFEGDEMAVAHHVAEHFE